MAGKKSGNLLFWFGIIFGAPLICGIKHLFLLKIYKGLYVFTKE